MNKIMNKILKIKGIPSTIQRTRISNKQHEIFNSEFHNYCIDLEQIKFLSKNILDKIFNKNAKIILDIGFGNAEQLFELATKFPEYNFIGVELYKKGIVNLINKIKQANLTNIKIIYGDIKSIIQQFDDNCIYKIQIFFPDPWPKLRHHKRRLINLNFLNIIKNKLLQEEGILHIATDCEDYSKDIIKNISMIPNYCKFLDYKMFRTTTKFAKIAISLGKNIWDLIFVLKSNID